MGPPIIPPKFGVSTRIAYWLILVTGLISAATMLVSMLPVFGTEDMLLLLDLHRYSGLILVAAFAIHFYRIFLERVGKG